MKYVAIVIGIALLSCGGCTPSATGPDDHIPSGTIVANPTSIRSFGSVALDLSAGGCPIDSVVVEYGDRQRELFTCGGKTTFAVSVKHTYLWKGIATVTLTVHSGRRYSTATLPITVAEDGGPVVRSLSIDVPEGDSLVLPCRDLIFDREGDPFEYQWSVSDPNVLVYRRDSIIVIRGIDGDYNGYARLRIGYSYRMDDSVLRTGTQELSISINPRDQIKGTVQDILAGTFIGIRDPALVLGPPFTAGSVLIDGKPVTLDLATGRFTSAKLVAWRSHTVVWSGFANALGDSGFSMSTELTPGDQEVTLRMHSTAGTGMSPKDLRDFYKEANFRRGAYGQRLCAPDYAHVQDLADHLAASGASIEGHTLAGFTAAQAELIAGWIDAEFNAILPLEYRIPLVRGSIGDTLPIIEANGTVLPSPGTAVAFVERTPGIINVPMVFMKGSRIESAWIRLRDDAPGADLGIARGRALGAFLARRAAPSGVVVDPRFAGKSCLAESGSGPADHLTGADRKLLWLTILHPAGTSIDAWWRVY